MSLSATRLTCFALISALEEDLRNAIEDAAEDANPETLLGGERFKRVNDRRLKDQGSRTPATFPALLPYLDFADAYEVLSRLRQKVDVDLFRDLDGLKPALEKLVSVRNRVAHSRPMEIDDLPTLIDALEPLNLGTAKSRWPNLRSVRLHLESDPSYVLGLTMSLPSDPDGAPENNLPVPDFDETGFFGRRTQLTRLKKAINGPYPVVSILGDGGIGKTALALKLAYELLDDPSTDFDAFVWASAKATVLTTNEIRRISGAVQDSLGLFALATSELGSTGNDPAAELLEYMEHFRILLFLDNLETVLDERLRDFLLELPVGSKVVVTSRISLGIENPVRLEPLEIQESANLLRALARVRNVALIQRATQDEVLEFAASMNGSPAYLRWFVSGVQSGSRPEDLLSENTLLLDFCMSNVYEFLGAQAKAVMRSLQALPGPKSQAELAFINDYNARDIQACLLELMTTNFVQMRTVSAAASRETTYELSEFANDYLAKRHPVAPDEQQWLRNRRQQLLDLGDSLRAESSASPFDPTTIDVRGAGDFHVARLLRDAIRTATERNDIDRALSLCKEAQVLSPNYAECWRIEGYIQDGRGDAPAALHAYERAVDLNSDSQVLNYLMGDFLQRNGYQPELSLEYLRRAVDPESPQSIVLATMSQVHMLRSDWESSIQTGLHAATSGVGSKGGSTQGLVTALTSAHLAVSAALSIGDEQQALQAIEGLLEGMEGTHPELLLSEAGDRVVQVRDDARSMTSQSGENYLAKKAQEFDHQLTEWLRRADVDLLDRKISTIRTVVDGKFFGFVRSTPKDYFFHVRDLAVDSPWDYVVAGATVAFTPRDSPRGPRAHQPRVLL